MPRALRVCSCIGCQSHAGSCPELVTTGRCHRCKLAAEQRRGSSVQRGYDRRHAAFRRAVLRRSPLCVCVDTTHGHGPRCLSPATRADHWPRDRRELVRLGLNPNDPQHGRALCAPCDSSQTAQRQPGGWAADIDAC